MTSLWCPDPGRPRWGCCDQRGQETGPQLRSPTTSWGKGSLPHFQTTSCCHCQHCGSLSPAHHRTDVPKINPQQGCGRPRTCGQSMWGN